MSVTLNLKPDVEADLLVQARAAGLSLDQFLSRQLEALVQTASPAALAVEVADHPGGNRWEKELDAWLDSFPQHPTLSDEALRRENWYPDRW